MKRQDWVSRKFWLALAAFLISVIALFKSGPSGEAIASFDQWADFIVWLLGVYVCGNVGAKGVKILNGKGK